MYILHSEFHQLLEIIFLLYSCTTVLEHHLREQTSSQISLQQHMIINGCFVLNQAFAICSSANYECYKYPQLHCKGKKWLKCIYSFCHASLLFISNEKQHHSPHKSHSRKTTEGQMFRAPHLAIGHWWLLRVQNVLCTLSKTSLELCRIPHTSEVGLVSSFAHKNSFLTRSGSPMMLLCR